MIGMAMRPVNQLLFSQKPGMSFGLVRMAGGGGILPRQTAVHTRQWLGMVRIVCIRTCTGNTRPKAVRCPMTISAAGLIYNPYLALDGQISATANDLTDVFGEIDSALDKGVGIKKAVMGDRVSAALRSRLAAARVQGFQHAAKYAKSRMPSLYGRTASDFAKKRAAKVNDWMNGTTRRTLKRAPDSEFVLSGDRAVAAARYENARAYFKGVKDAYAGGVKPERFRKKWNAAADACDDCLLAEDSGRIGIFDYFDNMMQFPPGHLSCGCWLVVT